MHSEKYSLLSRCYLFGLFSDMKEAIFSTKHQFIFNVLHGFILRKIVLFISTAVKTLNPILWIFPLCFHLHSQYYQQRKPVSSKSLRAISVLFSPAETHRISRLQSVGAVSITGSGFQNKRFCLCHSQPRPPCSSVSLIACHVTSTAIWGWVSFRAICLVPEAHLSIPIFFFSTLFSHLRFSFPSVDVFWKTPCR
jgi:hypothetical protein